ncbi:hypothetical protein ACFXGA_27215 [Actinosynnema sp. NPDC059335]|uniref:hypothetical protein n=1 Tax=Actinosynnema sp. NPDC059335 TaxID=3346804 RepID=UPI00366E33B5
MKNNMRLKRSVLSFASIVTIFATSITATTAPAQAAPTGGDPAPRVDASDKVYAYSIEKGGVFTGAKDLRLWVTVERTGYSYSWSGNWEARICGGTVGGPGQIGFDAWSQSGGYENRRWRECNDTNKHISGGGYIVPGERTAFRVCHWGGVVPHTSCGEWAYSKFLTS